MGDEGNGRRKGEKGGETRREPNRLEISRLLPARRSACKSRPVRSDTRDPQKNSAEREKRASYRFLSSKRTRSTPHRATPRRAPRAGATKRGLHFHYPWVKDAVARDLFIRGGAAEEIHVWTEKGTMRKRKRLRFKPLISILNLNIIKI